MSGADIVKGSERVSSLGAHRFILFGVLHKKLEKELDKKIKRTPTDHPGYNEYQYHLDPIEHDPWQLTSWCRAS